MDYLTREFNDWAYLQEPGHYISSENRLKNIDKPLLVIVRAYHV